MKSDLVIICQKMGLSTMGSKTDLFNRISNHLQGKKQKSRKLLVPTKRPAKITLETKLKEGWKADLITRNFFIKHIGQEFHFTYFLQEYVKSHPDKTYGDAIKFWKYQMAHKKEFTRKYTATGKFEYNNFVKKYYARKPGASLDEIIKAWNEYKKKRNKGCKEIMAKLGAKKKSNARF